MCKQIYDTAKCELEFYPLLNSKKDQLIINYRHITKVYGYVVNC